MFSTVLEKVGSEMGKESSELNGKMRELGNQILCFLMICYETLTESILSREQKGSTFF